MFLSEQELSVQIRCFNVIRICDNDFALLLRLISLCCAFACPEVYHSVVLEQLAPDSPRANEKHFAISDSTKQIISYDAPNALKSILVTLIVHLLKKILQSCLLLRYFGKDLQEVHQEVLADRHVLTSNRLESFLGSQASEECTDRPECARASQAEQFRQSNLRC